MGSTIYIPNRVNWIDWAKALAISFVLFGHIPQIKGSFMLYNSIPYTVFHFYIRIFDKEGIYEQANGKKILPFFDYTILML